MGQGITLEYAGRRIWRTGSRSTKTEALDGLRWKREIIARIICHEYPDQEIPGDNPPSADYTIELDGTPRRFALQWGEFKGFNVSLRKANYDTRQQRRKRRRFIRLQNLCMAYTNATIAIECYEQLLEESGPPPASGVEMLADACMTFGQQYSQFAQWSMQHATEAERHRPGANVTNKDHVELQKEYQSAVDELVKSGLSYTKATEKLQGEFGVSARTIQNHTVNKSPRHRSRHKKKE